MQWISTREQEMTTIAAVKPKPHILIAGNLLLFCGLLSGNASAQAVVTDPGHTIESIIGWGTQAWQKGQEYYRQGLQYEQQIKQFEQMNVKGEVVKAEPGYRETIQERSINEGVKKRCGDSPANNPVGPEQYQYCVAIVQTENLRFNVITKFIEGVRMRDEQMKAANKERDDTNQDENGKLISNSNRILSIQTQQQNDVQNAVNLLSAYDASLESLRKSQVQAANNALKGKSSLIDDAVQGAALHLALKAARHRDR